MDKQINPLAVIGRIPQQKASAVWNDTLSWGKKRCGSASEVFHLPHSSCSEALTHTHAQACCPPPMTTSWPHSSHLLLRPWLTCPPKRKISCPPPQTPTEAAQVQMLLGRIHTLTFRHVCAPKQREQSAASRIKPRKWRRCMQTRERCEAEPLDREGLGLNKNQLAKLYPVRGTNR